MIELKNGCVTEDPRLDRVPLFDEASRRFSIAPRVEGKPLKSRVHHSTLWLDQGREGACVSFSLHQMRGAEPVSVRGLSDAIARQRYWDMQREDPWPGGEYPGANPVYGGTALLTGAKVMQRLGFFQEYRWAFALDDALLALSHEGPIGFAGPWRDSMWDTRPDGMLDLSGREVGGHAIYARGVHVPRNGRVETVFPRSRRRVRIKTSNPLIRLRNSWGLRNFGIDGECLVDAQEWWDRFLAPGGESLIPVGRQRPAL